jgi:hypothetical protein
MAANITTAIVKRRCRSVRVFSTPSVCQNSVETAPQGTVTEEKDAQACRKGTSRASARVFSTIVVLGVLYLQVWHA